VTDDLRQRYADALLNASLDGLKEFQTFATLRDAALFAADVVLAVRDEEIERLRARLADAERTLTELAPLSHMVGVEADNARLREDLAELTRREAARD
jgi:hypothetical protein